MEHRCFELHKSTFSATKLTEPWSFGPFVLPGRSAATTMTLLSVVRRNRGSNSSCEDLNDARSTVALLWIDLSDLIVLHFTGESCTVARWTKIYGIRITWQRDRSEDPFENYWLWSCRNFDDNLAFTFLLYFYFYSPMKVPKKIRIDLRREFDVRLRWTCKIGSSLIQLSDRLDRIFLFHRGLDVMQKLKKITWIGWWGVDRR